MYIKNLQAQLTPLYEANGCHDLTHVLRMERMYEEIASLISGLDQAKFIITVWLHNLDRTKEMSREKLKGMLLGYLSESGLGPADQNDIITAILGHSKFRDDPDDSPLMQALRLADKWDRIGVQGGISAFQWLGCKMPAYVPGHIFGYGSTAEGDLNKGGKGGYTTLYQNFYRLMEWYTLFPMVQELVRRHPERFWTFLNLLRSYAAEIAEAHGVANEVEADIEKCLGSLYNQWAPK